MNTEIPKDNMKQETIMVVDDDDNLARALSRAFSRRGFEVGIAHDGEEAIEFCKNNKVDKVILDMKLEHESGLHLIPILLQEQAHIKILVLTGYSSVATAVEAIKQGAINYLCKPVDANEILQAFSEDSSAESTITDMVSPSLERREWEHIQRVLQENNGNISATARALNMHRRTLQRKLSKFPVKR